MKNKSFLLNYNNLIIFSYFIIIFFFSLTKVGDYGATIDDYIYFINGVHTYEYVKHIFLSIFNEGINLDFYRSSINEFPVFYEFVLVSICKLLNISDSREIFLTAHYLNFFLFFLSLIVFFRIIKKRFGNSLIALTGVTFFVLSPRIFAESFYNSRDIFFLCLFVFYSNSLINFLHNQNLKNTILFSFFTALLLNAKILGLVPIGLFCLLYMYNYLNTKRKFYRNQKQIYIFVIFCLFFIYILWPYLWDNPVKNLFFALKNMLEVHEKIILVNFYFGEYLSSDMMPWHYRIVWFLITTPVVILILFFSGLFLSGKKIIKLFDLSLDKKFEFNNKEFFDLFLILTLFFSFFIVLEFNKSKFGGWRHLYYLYPISVYFALYFINFLFTKKTNFLKYFAFTAVFLNLTYNLIWFVKNHPHQYVYFNFIAKNYAMKNFDLDWWGVSHKSSVDYILSKDTKEEIKIFVEGFASLRDTLMHLKDDDRKRVKLTDYKDADYVIDSKMKRLRVNNNLAENNSLELIYELIIDQQPINSVYKKITIKK